MNYKAVLSVLARYNKPISTLIMLIFAFILASNITAYLTICECSITLTDNLMFWDFIIPIWLIVDIYVRELREEE